LKLKIQTNDMSHDEKMTLMRDELETARLDGNVGREKELLTFAHGQEMDKIAQGQGFQQSLVYLNDELAAARDAEDFTRTRILTQMQFNQEMKLHQSISAVDQAKNEMIQEGLNITRFESDIAALQKEVEAGRLDPSVLTAYKENVMANSLPDGFEFTEPDQNAVQDALTADYVNQQFQWALTQGDADGDGLLDAGTYDADGNFTGLTDENFEAFTGHMAETIYDIEGGNILANKRIDIKSTGDFEELATNEELYQSFIEDVTIPKIKAGKENYGFIERYKGDGGKARSIFTEFENNEWLNMDGVIMHVDSINRDSKAGDDDTHYVLTNPLTGQKQTIVASDRG
jgi:hypothetical protein